MSDIPPHSDESAVALDPETHAELEQELERVSDLSPEERERARAALRAQPEALPVAREPEDLRMIIQNADLPQKMKLALFGNAVARGLLIRDPNKLIQACVLKNPKLATTEVEAFAKNPNVAEQVLRLIADSRQLMKDTSVRSAVVRNPKTPVDIALKWLRYLQKNEIKELSKSKGVSHVVSTAARRLIN